MMDTAITFITPIYAGFFGIMLVVLSRRVTTLRLKNEDSKIMRDTGHNELTAAVRAQGNFIEYLPLALLLMWMLEIMQFSAWLIHALGILLVISRLMHVHGLNQPNAAGKGRKMGTQLTWLHIIVCSLLAFAGSLGVIF